MTTGKTVSVDSSNWQPEFAFKGSHTKSMVRRRQHISLTSNLRGEAEQVKAVDQSVDLAGRHAPTPLRQELAQRGKASALSRVSHTPTK